MSAAADVMPSLALGTPLVMTARSLLAGRSQRLACSAYSMILHCAHWQHAPSRAPYEALFARRGNGTPARVRGVLDVLALRTLAARAARPEPRAV